MIDEIKFPRIVKLEQACGALRIVRYFDGADPGSVASVYCR